MEEFCLKTKTWELDMLVVTVLSSLLGPLCDPPEFFPAVKQSGTNKMFVLIYGILNSFFIQE